MDEIRHWAKRNTMTASCAPVSSQIDTGRLSIELTGSDPSIDHNQFNSTRGLPDRHSSRLACESHFARNSIPFRQLMLVRPEQV